MAEETEQNSETKEEQEEKPESRSLTQEEINKLIEGARKQEKDKLYDTITSLRDKVTELSEQRKKENEDKEKAAQEAQQKLEQERLAKMSAEDKVTEQLKRLEERLIRSDERATKLESDLDQERTKAELERYRAELLQGEKDLIPELVVGDTKEQIAASVQSSKQKYQLYFEAAVKKAEGTPGRKVTVPGPADPDPDPIDEEDLKGLRGLTRPDMTTGSMKSREEIIANRTKGVSKEYVKQKDELLDKVGELYRKSVRG